MYLNICYECVSRGSVAEYLLANELLNMYKKKNFFAFLPTCIHRKIISVVKITMNNFEIKLKNI